MVLDFLKKQRIYLLTLSIAAFFGCDLLKSIISFTTGRADWAINICNIILASLVLLSTIMNYRKIKTTSLAIVLFCFLSIILTIVCHPDYIGVMFINRNIFNEIFGLHSGLLLFFLITLSDDNNETFKALKIGTFLCFLDRVIKVFIGTGYLSSSSNSNHEFGYMFLFIASVFFIDFIMKKKSISKYISLLVFISSSLFMILVGARTTIIAYLLFFVLLILFLQWNPRRFLKRIGFVTLLVVLVILLLYSPIKNVIGNVISGFGVNSKILNAFVSGENALDGGRIEMYKNDFVLLSENPLGLGVYWDRYVYDGWSTYTHSLFYEFIIGYGWFVGGALMLLLTFNIFRLLFDRNSFNDSYKFLLIVFLCLWVVRLVLSYSFWLDYSFWATIAILVNYRQHIRHKKIYSFQGLRLRIS